MLSSPSGNLVVYLLLQRTRQTPAAHRTAALLGSKAAVISLSGQCRPEEDNARCMAISVLGNGLYAADHSEDALSVMEANISMRQRIGASAHSILVAQGNLANTYEDLGRKESALSLQRDVYFGSKKLFGLENQVTLSAASNYAVSLAHLQRYAEAKSLLRKTVPVARRFVGESNEITLKMRWLYGRVLYRDTGATLDDLCEAATTLEDTERTARRVLGGAHPITKGIEREVTMSRAALRAREDTAPGGDVNAMREAMAAMTADDA